MIRRILDLLGLAPYPKHPSVGRLKDFSLGLNCHVNMTYFSEIRAAGFDTVLLDVVEGYDPGRLFEAAKSAGLKIFITGFDDSVEKKAGPLFRLHGEYIDYCAVRNEPDLARFYSGSLEQFADEIRVVADLKSEHAPHVKIVAPCFSSLGSSARPGWRDKRSLIDRLGRILGADRGKIDILGHHVYKDTPDEVGRYVRTLREWYRAAGFQQPIYISETGWRSKKIGEEKQATYLANVLAQLSRLSGVCGAGIYEAQDDPPGSYGLRRGDGREKKSWERVRRCLRANGSSTATSTTTGLQP
ncbi:MAG: hypothetical protein ACREEP_13100 [Dongiaceae bacterium]